MNWDDLRFVLAVSKAGSLLGAARALGVEHTTVGRRVASLEGALGVTLFTRNATGYVRTADAERLLAPLLRVEEAVLELERAATTSDALAGPVRVTSPETFGAAWLAPRLARFCRAHPGVQLELVPSGAVLDLGRREAELAVRMFRSTQAGLVARRAGRVAWGLYGSHDYLGRSPVLGPDRLHEHALLGAPDGGDLERRWLQRLDRKAQPRFTSALSLALLAAARASAGLAMLPRYLGDAEPGLRRVDLPDPPCEDVWLTVHRDLRQTPRVRALLDFLADELARDPSLDPAQKST
jgi:DNA-binding transcriptional LysR family regulator